MSRRLPIQVQPMIEIFKMPIEGCRLIKYEPFKDTRGEFSEAFNYDLFARWELPTEWDQDNLTYSKNHVIRGLHIQKHNPQGKLVRCITGSILDVCVDLRPRSSTYKQVVGEILTEKKALYCPPGTAHGFAVLSHEAYVYYKCTSLYDKSSDGGILWNDPDLGIEWPWEDPIMSEKDKSLPKLSDYLNTLK